MAATGTPTPNLGLRIPVGTDPASVDDINYNSNLLDTVLGAVGNTSVKDQLDGLSDQIANILQNEKLLDASSLSTTATSYNLTKEFTKYVMVSLLLKYQGIYIDCITIPASIFNTTSSTNYIRLLSGDVEVHMYKNTTSAIYAFSSTTTSNLKIEMIGFIKNS